MPERAVARGLSRIPDGQETDRASRSARRGGAAASSRLTKRSSYSFRAARQARRTLGIKNMGRIPGLMLVIDAKKERIAVARRKNRIPIVEIVDTTPIRLITVPMPATRAIVRWSDHEGHLGHDRRGRRDAPQRADRSQKAPAPQLRARGFEPAAAGGAHRGRMTRAGAAQRTTAAAPDKPPPREAGNDRRAPQDGADGEPGRRVGSSDATVRRR